ncbi:MAG TPA: PRC-barrel domain-containing protein [Longimicrobiales bacterium]|nr:PRC-barrel domain-containing protein [Longimicrobiales bacterium]
MGRLFGTLAEERTGLIRYLDVSLDSAKRHVLVPIGHARVDREAIPPRVRLRAATFEDLMAVPQYEPGATEVTAEYQSDLVQAHGRLFYGERYYAHPAFDHTHLFAGDQPVEPAGEPPREPRLVPLTELPDYRVAEDGLDVRGLPLEDRRGERAGAVLEFLVDEVARRVRYVVVALDEPQRSTVLPVGYLEVDAEEGRAYTPELSAADLRILPAHTGPLGRDEENRIQMALEGVLSGERFFERADFRGSRDGWGSAPTG